MKCLKLYEMLLKDICSEGGHIFVQIEITKKSTYRLEEQFHTPHFNQTFSFSETAI